MAPLDAHTSNERARAAAAAVGAPRLAEIPLLAGAAPATVEELEAAARPLSLRAGERLFSAGDAADALYVVFSGRLLITVPTPEGPRTVRELGAGAALGELALLTGAPRSADVTAVRDTELLDLDRVAFAAVLRSDPSFAIAVARSLATQLQASGGLVASTPRPAVLAVRALGPSVDARSVAAELEESLAAFGSVASLGVVDLPADDPSALDRAEREHDFVLLVDDESSEAWTAFCARQSDRRLALAAPGADDAARAGEGCDLIVVAPLERSSLEALLDAAAPLALHHVEPGARRRSFDRLARRLAGRSLGVVLSGGGARGFAHIGALGALAEAGFTIDRIGGCSIGSLIGAMAAKGWGPAEMRDRCHSELVARSPFSDYTVPRFALIRSRRAARMLERLFGDELVEEAPRPFFAVSADLLTSRLVVHRRGRLLEAVGASMSIPGVAPPVPGRGRLLVDGGVLNNLPVDTMAEADEGPIVAVDVIRKLDEPGDAEPALPSIMETLARATVLSSVERAEANRKLAALVITPEVQSIGLREFSAIDRAVAAGRETTLRSLEDGGAERLRAVLEAQP